LQRKTLLPGSFGTAEIGEAFRHFVGAEEPEADVVSYELVATGAQELGRFSGFVGRPHRNSRRGIGRRRWCDILLEQIVFQGGDPG
jgi:hypothetical protein